MKEITGNILMIDSGIICHQVNCQKVAGAGLALQIANKYPDWLAEFEERNSDLGNLWIYDVSNDLRIASFYAQNLFGSGRRTKYDALDECARKLNTYNQYADLPIYIPYKLGCGLGGGNWNVVKAILQQHLDYATIVRLPND